MWKTKAAAPHRAAAFCLCGTILNALRVALGIFSGRIILNFGFQKSLRAFLNPIFTKGNGRCRDTPSVLPLRVKPPSPRGRLNSLSQNLTVLPAPSGREPLAWRESLRFCQGPHLRGGCRRRRLGEFYPPPRRAFAESGAVAAVFLHDPSCEKDERENPQIFPFIKYKNNNTAIYAQQRRRPPPVAETGRSCWGSGQQDARAAQGTKRMLRAATR